MTGLADAPDALVQRIDFLRWRRPERASRRPAYFRI
jgi:hypothetical protein